MSDEGYKIERFVFPDGRSVEMMVFDKVPALRGPAPAPCCAAPPPRKDLEAHRCPVCDGALVYPLDWDRSGPSSWTLELRCPECETRREVTLDRASVEQFNRVLYSGAQAIARAADQLTRRNFEDEVDKIVVALERDLILPMDF